MNIGLFIFVSGFIIGLGSVTVIDWLGFLARKSSYWTEATIRSHKLTKVLIWIGTFLAVIGGIIFYWGQNLSGIPLYHLILAIVLILNGIFLSFYISPILIKREKLGKSKELLPQSLQNKILLSFVVSFLGWWGSLILLIIYIS